MPFEPSDPAWESRVRASFARQPMMATIGARLERVAPGEVDVRVPFHEAISQHHGFVHAGALTTAVDTACGYAALSLMPPGATRSSRAPMVAIIGWRAKLARTRDSQAGSVGSKGIR